MKTGENMQEQDIETAEQENKNKYIENVSRRVQTETEKISQNWGLIMQEQEQDIETVDQENEIVDRIKKQMRDVLADSGRLNDECSSINVYALLELAVEIAKDSTFFIEASEEVASVYDEMPEIILRTA